MRDKLIKILTKGPLYSADVCQYFFNTREQVAARAELREMVREGVARCGRDPARAYIYSLPETPDIHNSRPTGLKKHPALVAEIRALEHKARTPGLPLQQRRELSYRVSVLRERLKA